MKDLMSFLKTSGFSKSLFSEVVGLSTDTLTRYIWSDTDYMRHKTIAKIENAIDALDGVRIILHSGMGGIKCYQLIDGDKHFTAADRRAFVRRIQKTYLEG